MTSPGARDTGVLSRLNHVAFEYPTLAELLGAYRRLAGSSIRPAVSLNHGPTMSIYSQDPDRNIVENDVSARDLMEGESRTLNSPILLQIMRAKDWDTFLPTGPWLVTADEAGSYENIRIQTWVNDESRQDAYAKEMTNSPSEIIEWLSATTTLQPGDIITTGTPAGVAMCMADPRWLTPGDTVRIQMTGLGAMVTPVHQEPASS